MVVVSAREGRELPDLKEAAAVGFSNEGKLKSLDGFYWFALEMGWSELLTPIGTKVDLLSLRTLLV